MHRHSEKANSTEKASTLKPSLRKLNLLLAAAAALSIPAAFLFKSYLHIFVIGLLICIIIATYKMIQFNVSFGRFVSALTVIITLVTVISLLGFYSSNTQSVGEFDNGLTWVSSKSIGSGLYGSVFYPDTFTAGLFGLDCNGTYGPNCSSTPVVLALGLDGAIFLGGIIIANKLTKNDISRITTV